MSKIVVFDPFSGASGDMILGALIDVGAPLVAIQDAVARLGIEGVRISTEPASAGAVRGTRVQIAQLSPQPSRDWRGIRSLLQDSSLPPAVRDAALAVFTTLAEAEALAHNEPVEQVHFHEVGAVDAIADVVGACAALAALGAEQIVSHPVAVGAGWVRADHGLMPVPAPATANIIAAHAIPLRAYPVGQEPPGELFTPTGAALLGALAEWQIPGFVPQHVGHGFGTKQLPWPNALRVWVGETAQEGEAASTTDLLLETNIDDMNPQFFELLSERLFAAGALDVWLSHAIMKKGRPATVVSAIVPENLRAEAEQVFFLQSTTIGVRATPISMTRAPRRFVSATTRWGDVLLKLRGWDGRVIGVTPEYDDCFRLSRESGAPIREIWNEAHRLGEVYVGQKWE